MCSSRSGGVSGGMVGASVTVWSVGLRPVCARGVVRICSVTLRVCLNVRSTLCTVPV